MNIEDNYDRIYRYCHFRVRAREAAEDITQEVFLKFIKSGYEERGKELNYLYVIARNLCADYLAGRMGERFLSLNNDVGVPRGSESTESAEINTAYASAADFADNVTISLHIRRALETFSESDRELLILRYVNDEPIKTLCDITGESRFAVYRRLNRVKSELRHLLDDGSYDYG